MNNKQKIFCQEYVKDFNAAQAAIRAGYSQRTARQIGSRLLTDVDIKAYVAELTEMRPDEVKARLADIARGDVADLMALSTGGFTFELMIDDGQGNKIPNPKTKLIRRLRQKVTTYLGKKEDDEDREVVETEIELYDAQAALRDIGKIHGLFIDKTELSGPQGGAIPVEHFENALKKVYGNGPDEPRDIPGES